MKKFLFAFTLILIFFQATRASAQQKKATKIDVDLTKMSTTIVYSQLFNMIAEPERYLGKTVKIKGTFASYDLPPEFGRKKAFAVVILDATACCQQGIEFVWEGNHQYPKDYPAEGKSITVTGVFQSYRVQNYDCFCLKTNDVQF